LEVAPVAALGSDLVNGVVIDQDGTLYCAGQAEGWVWCEHSLDGGLTQATWISGGTRRAICEAADDAAPGLEALPSGELIAVVALDDLLRIWSSRDAGEHWEGLGAL
jgi:hypothetical protein